MVRFSFLLLLYAFLPVALGVSATGRALATGYRFPIATVNASPGESVRVTIQGDHEESAQGFSIAGRYDSQHMTLDRIHAEDTILEAMVVDYFERKISEEEGIFTIGALLDTAPPFEGEVIPAMPDSWEPLDFVHLEITVAEAAEGFLSIRLEDGLFNPPVDNIFSIANQPVSVTEFTEGGILAGPHFFRGDVNMDAYYDLSDPIMSLEFVFRGGFDIACLTAADANDDGQVDREEFHHRMVEVFFFSDQDRNGYLVVVEYERTPIGSFSDLDRDGDGRITLYEFCEGGFIRSDQDDSDENGLLSLEEVVDSASP